MNGLLHTNYGRFIILFSGAEPPISPVRLTYSVRSKKVHFWKVKWILHFLKRSTSDRKATLLINHPPNGESWEMNSRSGSSNHPVTETRCDEFTGYVSNLSIECPMKTFFQVINRESVRWKFMESASSALTVLDVSDEENAYKSSYLYSIPKPRKTRSSPIF